MDDLDREIAEFAGTAPRRAIKPQWVRDLEREAERARDEARAKKKKMPRGCIFTDTSVQDYDSWSYESDGQTIHPRRAPWWEQTKD